MNNWQTTSLGELLSRSTETAEIQPDESYKEITVRLWGKGVVLRGVASGSELNGSRRFLARKGQLILSRIDARNGAIGMVPESLDGSVVSNDFPLFDLDRNRIQPSYFEWLTKTKPFVELCQKASEGTTNRVRLQEGRFLNLQIPLPPLSEQRRIVARIEELAAKINEARKIRSDVEKEQALLLSSAFHRIAANAPRQPLGEIAPLTRRAVPIDPEKEYPQIAVRSFGKGTFHKPPLAGSDVTWQKPFLVQADDILISNIKAWEGAIAVAANGDDGRVGSHRYLTCVPRPSVATARFICFYLLTAEGLYHVGEASPGSADRNRTLSSKALLQIPIPAPSFEQQLWFDRLYRKVDALKSLQSKVAIELVAMLPSILDKAFKGEF